MSKFDCVPVTCVNMLTKASSIFAMVSLRLCTVLDKPCTRDSMFVRFGATCSACASNLVNISSTPSTPAASCVTATYVTCCCACVMPGVLIAMGTGICCCAAAHPGANKGPSSPALLGLRSRPCGLRTGEPNCAATHGGRSVPDMAPLIYFEYMTTDCLDRSGQPRQPATTHRTRFNWD